MYTPKLKPENINRQTGGYRLYRVFEVYGIGNFSMLFNVRADATAICEWKNECHRTKIQKLLSGDLFVNNGYQYKGISGYKFKVRERRIHSGIQYTQTAYYKGFTHDFNRAEQGARSL